MDSALFAGHSGAAIYRELNWRYAGAIGRANNADQICWNLRILA